MSMNYLRYQIVIKSTTRTKYTIKFTSDFKKDYKRIIKQGKDISRLKYIVTELANGNNLNPKYKNHMLTNSKYYKNCGECHITPDWLLVYKYSNNELILLLVATGSHSELF